MKKIVYTLMMTTIPFNAKAITQVVAVGDTVSNGYVDAPFVQNVHGTTQNYTIYSTQTIMDGGAAYNTYIYSYGQQNVQSGGNAYNSTVASRGTMSVAAGGNAEGTTINGGTMTVANGATAKNTVLNSGKMNVSGTDENAVINGGTQEILSGGTSIGAQINGATQQIDAGATSSDAVVSNGGRIRVYGTANGALVNSSSSIYVYGSGNVTNITSNGGWVEINSSATATDTALLNSASMSVYGSADNTTIDNAYQRIYSGGTAQNTTLKNKGFQTIYSGGESSGVTAESGSIVSLYAGGTLSGTNSFSDSLLNIVGGNTINDLTVSNATINVTYNDENFTNVSFTNLNGSAVFDISTSLSDDTSDQISIVGGAGNFGLVVHDYSFEGNTPEKYQIIAQNTASDSFYLVGDAVDVGAYEYTLAPEGGNWFLVKTQDVTESSVIAKNTYTALSSLFYTHLNPVYSHVRGLRKNSEPKNRLWVKGLGRRIELDYNAGGKSRIDVYGTEAGYDQDVNWDWDSTLTLGAFAGYTNSKQIYHLEGRGDGDTKSLGLYGIFKTPSKWFVDLVGTYFWHKQKIKSYTPAGRDVESRYRAHSVLLASNLGKRFELKKDWFVETSLGVEYMHINGIDYRTNFNTRVEAEGANYLRQRIDAIVGKSFNLAEDKKVEGFARFGLVHDSDNKSVVKVADYTFDEDMSSLRYELGGGVNFYWGDGNFAYLEALTEMNSKIEVPYEITLGIQYAF